MTKKQVSYFLLKHSVRYLHIIDNQLEAVNSKICRCP